MKYDAISYLQSRLDHLQNPVNLSEFLFDLSDYYDTTPSERAFYNCKQDYLHMCAQNWQQEIKQVTAKLNHLTQ
jgi:hypothetical protein